MKLENVKDIVVDFVKGGFRFGRGFSDFVAEKLEIKNRKATGFFDAAAGLGVTYMGAVGVLGTTLGALVAIPALVVAPISAALTIVTAPIWLTFAVITTGIGLGLLDAAREKFGISRSIDGFKGAAKKAGDDASSTLRNIVARGKKASNDFKASAKAADPAPVTAAPEAKPAPKAGPQI